MKFPHLVSQVFHEPWMIVPEQHVAIQEILTARVRGEKGVDVVAAAAGGDDDDGRPRLELLGGGFGLVQVHGILGKRLSGFEMMCGGCDVDDVAAAVEDETLSIPPKSIVTIVSGVGK